MGEHVMPLRPLALPQCSPEDLSAKIIHAKHCFKVDLGLHVQELIHVKEDIIAMELPAPPINPLRQLAQIAQTAKEMV